MCPDCEILKKQNLELQRIVANLSRELDRRWLATSRNPSVTELVTEVGLRKVLSPQERKEIAFPEPEADRPEPPHPLWWFALVSVVGWTALAIFLWYN